MQPPAGAQSELSVVCVQPLIAHASCVHANPSSHIVASSACAHPVAGTHESVVHATWSLQSNTAPGTQPVVGLAPAVPGAQRPTPSHTLASAHSTSFEQCM